MSVFENFNIRTAFLFFLKGCMDVLILYGYGVVMSALFAGIIGGYAGLFGGMTISGAVLLKALLQRLLCRPEGNGREKMTAVIPLAVCLCVTDVTHALYVLAYTVLCYGISFGIKKKIPVLNGLLAAGGIGLSLWMALSSVCAEHGILSGILFAESGLLLMNPVFEREEGLCPDTRIGFLAKALSLPLYAGAGYYLSVCLRQAEDLKELFRIIPPVWKMIVCAVLLAVCFVLSGYHEIEEDEELLDILIGALLAGGYICTKDLYAGITSIAVLAAGAGALTFLQKMTDGDGEKYTVLRTLILSIGELVLLFVGIARYDGRMFNLAAALGIWFLYHHTAALLECMPLSGEVTRYE